MIVGGIVLIVAFVIVVVCLPARAADGPTDAAAAVPADVDAAAAPDPGRRSRPPSVGAAIDDLPEEALT